MAGRLYSFPLDNISVTTDSDQDIFGISSAATKQVILHGFSLTSTLTTDERVRLRLFRRTGVGSGGGTVTVLATDQGNAIAAASTARSLDTTPGTGSSLLKAWAWSQQGEFLYLPTPDFRPVISVSSFLALNLQTAVGGTRSWSGWVCFEEI